MGFSLGKPSDHWAIGKLKILATPQVIQQQPDQTLYWTAVQRNFIGFCKVERQV
ncbi:hypothetical protein [Synechocystis sp. PCC 7338]|uniref:hypothetical protein n=1 Tax=Synechocystis sp. PCC 7338 TaxID=2732530 RepID=UPI001BAEF33E|nr:hypothetical protein [Synechocystis sp. PCC 7338]QUS59897.1 hypothetical protein HTZ78_03865 [Synechocystis sp. PCC 7338]